MIVLAWSRWVAFLGEREEAHALAAARVIAGTTLAWHLASTWLAGVPEAVWVGARHGGYFRVDETWISWAGGATPGVVGTMVAVTCLAGVLLALGAFTRIAAVVAWLGFARLCDLNWQTGGSSDELLVNVLFLLMLSGCGNAWSVDAWRRGEERDTPAWPRRVLVLQLVIVYFATALQKVSSSWVPGGPLDALWYILQQPTWQKHDWRWLAPLFPLTRLATLVTWLFEMLSPLLLVALWLRRTADRGGRLRAAFAKVRFRSSYLALGFVLHLGIWATLEVGPFLGGILALYASCFRPAEWRAASAAAAGKLSGIKLARES